MTRAHYAFLWVDYALNELFEDPDSFLIPFTHPSTAEGLIGWKPEVEYVYLSPKTPHESLLSLEIRDILRTALLNALCEAECIRNPRSQMRWSVRSVIEAQHLSEMLAPKDPLAALHAHRRLNALNTHLQQRLSDLRSVLGGGSDGIMAW